MGLFVRSNVASLNAQRNLNGAASLSRSFQRLFCSESTQQKMTPQVSGSRIG